MTSSSTSHIDTFARDNLPPVDQQPEFLFDLPSLQFTEYLNCATELLDRHVQQGNGDRLCIQGEDGTRWTYSDLQDKANRIAQVLVHDMGLVPGNRVLLRAPNNPMLAACWFAIMKAGGIAVATMPLLREKELRQIVEKGKVQFAFCDKRLADELPKDEMVIRYFNDPSENGLEAAMAHHSGQFANVATKSDDTCLLAFTSGTTGVPKATMHFHRDVMAICLCFPPHILRPKPDDIFTGSPPMAFTFGLGGILLFPMTVGASTVLLEKASPPQLLEAIKKYNVTTVFTAPTSYRVMAAYGEDIRKTSLRQCVAAGEALPAATRALWKKATGIEIIDGIGATEMLHIFISADEANARPGATGTPVPGYKAKVVDGGGNDLPPNTIGKLAVKGPTGCRYLNDERQKAYVQNGWNLTGDAYLMDDDGYFHYQSRTDDMIISSGYNIASPEVEDALLMHPHVAECGVIGIPDEERGQIVKAFVVLHQGHARDEAMIKTLQDFVKATVAPYKYPRQVEFVDSLPRTETGKLQRFRLKS